MMIAARCALRLGPAGGASFRGAPRRLASGGGGGPYERFWRWTTQPRPSWRESKTEAAVVFCVFGVTGSTSVAVVRPILRETTGIEGSMRDGPWSYRVFSLLAVSPVYACILVGVGTAAGRHTYFRMMAQRIYGRFLPFSLAPPTAAAAPAAAPAAYRGVANQALRSARYRAPK